MSGRYDHLIERLRSGTPVYKEEVEQAKAELYDKDEQSRRLFMYILALYGLEIHLGSNVLKEGRPVGYHEDLVLRLKAGLPVPKEEIQAVADELQALLDAIGSNHNLTRDENSRANALLNVLGNSGDSSYAPLVERLIRPPWEGEAVDVIVWYALLVLFYKWQIPASQYASEIPRIITKVGGMAGGIASDIAVEYLRDNRDAGLLRGLIEVVEVKNLHPERRYDAYRALYRLVMDGKGLSDDFDLAERTKYGQIDLLQVLDPTVLQKVKQRLTAQE